MSFPHFWHREVGSHADESDLLVELPGGLHYLGKTWEDPHVSCPSSSLCPTCLCSIPSGDMSPDLSILFLGRSRGCLLLGTSGGPDPGHHHAWPEPLWTRRTPIINCGIANFSTSTEQRKAQGSNFSLCTQSPTWQPLQWAFWQVILLRESLTFCSCPRQSLIKFCYCYLDIRSWCAYHILQREGLCELKISGYVHSRSCIKQCLGSWKVEEFNQNAVL